MGMMTDGKRMRQTAFRLSEQTLERLDEIVATVRNPRDGQLLYRRWETRTSALRRLIDDAFAKVMEEKTPPPPPVVTPKKKTAPAKKAKGKKS